MTGYYPRDEERPGYRAARDTESLNASYERFLRAGVSIVVSLHFHLSNTKSANTFLELLSKFNPMVLDLLENLLGLLWEAMLATQLMSVQ